MVSAFTRMVIQSDLPLTRENSLLLLSELDPPHYPPVLFPHSSDGNLYAVSRSTWVVIHSSLTLDDVRSVWRPLPLISVSMVWKVKSDSTDEIYTVKRIDDAFTCSCIGFVMHKRCKHSQRKKNELIHQLK